MRGRAAALRPGLRAAGRPLCRQAVDTGCVEQPDKALARVEHAGFDGIEGDAENIGHILDRLLLVIHQIDDLAVLPRQSAEALAEHGRAVLIADFGLRIARGVDDREAQVAVETLERLRLYWRQTPF